MGKSTPAIPYMITAKMGDEMCVAQKCQFNGKQVFTMDSRTTTCTGNEPGTAGGSVNNILANTSAFATDQISNATMKNLTDNTVDLNESLYDGSIGEKVAGKTLGEGSIFYDVHPIIIAEINTLYDESIKKICDSEKDNLEACIYDN